MIEMACYTNLFVFSTIKLKFEDDEIIVDITAHISGVVTLVLLVVVILYHNIMYTILSSKCLIRCQIPAERQLDDSEPTNDNAIDPLSTENYDHHNKPTFSILELNLPVS